MRKRLFWLQKIPPTIKTLQKNSLITIYQKRLSIQEEAHDNKEDKKDWE